MKVRVEVWRWRCGGEDRGEGGNVEVRVDMRMVWVEVRVEFMVNVWRGGW